MSRPRQKPDCLIEIKVVIEARKIDIPELTRDVIKYGASKVLNDWGQKIVEEVVREAGGVHALELSSRK